MSRSMQTKGADPEGGGSNYSGRTPLMQAASSGSMQLVQLLLDAGADPEAEDRFGRYVSPGQKCMATGFNAAGAWRPR